MSEQNEPIQQRQIPAFCIAGTHSGAGKTTVALGLLAALSRRYGKVQPFKCGPDFIDAGHHEQACGVPSRNLDTWMMGDEAVKTSFRRASAAADAVVVEEVMGLFDGARPDSLAGSTAYVCQILDLPVFLVVDAKAMARSIAALVQGFSSFEQGVGVAGVIANNVGSEKHTELLRKALSAADLPPLLGALPRSSEWETEERHLGLIAGPESDRDSAWFERLADGMEKHLDLRLLPRRPQAEPLQKACPFMAGGVERRVRLGIARDAAFHFYYEDNLDLLREAGAELVPFSPLEDDRLPNDLDGLYIGGGFPEMFAGQLAANASLRNAIRDFADAGGQIYAECGGYMYLGQALIVREGRRWKMCGALSHTSQMRGRLQRLGYVELKTRAEGIFGPAGTVVRGHEFHWSSILEQASDVTSLYTGCFARTPGETQTFGVRYKNTCASYVHLHFGSNPDGLPQLGQ